MNNAAVKKGVQIFLQDPVFLFFRVYTQSGIARSYSIFSFYRNHYTVFHSGCTILYSQPQCTRVPVFPHLSQHLLFSVLFFLIVAIRCEGISHISVDFCFPKSFTQSWIRWFVCLLLLLNFRSSLCIFWILIPYIRFANIFLSFCGLPLYTMNNVFVEKHRFKIFMKSSLSIFSFVTCTFGVIS